MEGFQEEVTLELSFGGWGRGRHFRWNGENVQTTMKLERLVGMRTDTGVCVCVWEWGVVGRCGGLEGECRKMKWSTRAFKPN